MSYKSKIAYREQSKGVVVETSLELTQEEFKPEEAVQMAAELYSIAQRQSQSFKMLKASEVQ